MWETEVLTLDGQRGVFLKELTSPAQIQGEEKVLHAPQRGEWNVYVHLELVSVCSPDINYLHASYMWNTLIFPSKDPESFIPLQRQVQVQSSGSAKLSRTHG